MKKVSSSGGEGIFGGPFEGVAYLGVSDIIDRLALVIRLK